MQALIPNPYTLGSFENPSPESSERKWLISSTADKFKRFAVNSKSDFSIQDGKPSKKRGILEALCMGIIYPAQTRSFKNQTKETFLSARSRLAEIFCRPSNETQLICREVSLERNNVRYDGLLFQRRTSPQDPNKRNWILQAVGNCDLIENSCLEAAKIYAKAGFNTLCINGPGVGRSEGLATPQSMGEAQRMGLCFLETTLKAKNIAMAGHSLGGAAIGQAILQHTFNPKVNYLAIRQYAFDRLSNTTEKMAGSLAKHLLPASLEMDNVHASKKLQQLGIKEVIIQAANQEIDSKQTPKIEDFETDGVIPAQASLGYRLVQEGIIKEKIFHCIKNANHNDFYVFLESTRHALERSDWKGEENQNSSIFHRLFRRCW